MPKGDRVASAVAPAGNDRSSAKRGLGTDDHPGSDLSYRVPPATASGSDHPSGEAVDRGRPGFVTAAETIAPPRASASESAAPLPAAQDPTPFHKRCEPARGLPAAGKSPPSPNGPGSNPPTRHAPGYRQSG